MADGDIQKFIGALVHYCMIFAAVLAVVLLMLAVILSWQPELLLELRRFVLAMICIVGAVWITGTLLSSLFWKGEKCNCTYTLFGNKTRAARGLIPLPP